VEEDYETVWLDFVHEASGFFLSTFGWSLFFFFLLLPININLRLRRRRRRKRKEKTKPDVRRTNPSKGSYRRPTEGSSTSSSSVLFFFLFVSARALTRFSLIIIWKTWNEEEERREPEEVGETFGRR